jgi:non-homologous end joining protein Ku
MARAIWTGSISFGLVSIPVRLYSAVEREGELSFRLLHAKDRSRIDYKRFCHHGPCNRHGGSDATRGCQASEAQASVCEGAEVHQA